MLREIMNKGNELVRCAALAAGLTALAGAGCDAPTEESAQISPTPPVTTVEGDEIVLRLTMTVTLQNREPNTIDLENRYKITKGQEELTSRVVNRTAAERVDIVADDEAATIALSAGGAKLVASAAPVGVDDRISLNGSAQTYDAAEAGELIRQMPIYEQISPETWLAMRHGLEMEEELDLPTARWGKVKSAFKWVWSNVITWIINHVKV